jgi:cardiolipin synthase
MGFYLRVRGRRHVTYIWICLVFALVLLLPGCSWTTSNDSTFLGISTAHLPPTQDGSNTLYWGVDIKKKVLEMIQQSRRICHLTMYELGDSDVLHALSDAYTRGVDVRLVLDATEPHTEKVAIPYLEQAGIPFRLLRVSNGISHIKSLVTDDGKASNLYNEIMGGMNFGSQSWNNLDASVYLEHTSQDFEELFERDWAVAAGSSSSSSSEIRSTLFLYDRQIKAQMLEAVQQAKHRIDIAAFNLSDSELIQQLLLATSRGIQVRVLLEPTEKQNQKTAKLLRRAGVQVAFYKHIKNEILHAKILSIDDGSMVWIGSANLSRQAFQINHEGDLVFRNAFAFGDTIRACLDKEWQRE